MEGSSRELGRAFSVEMIVELTLVLPCHLTLVKINSGVSSTKWSWELPLDTFALGHRPGLSAELITAPR